MLNCYYCKAVIDANKDYCRCCKGALGIFKCPGCCGFLDVRCFRKECAKKACEEEASAEGGGVGKDRFLRERCASCSPSYCGGCVDEKCNVEGDEIICIECGDLQDDRYQGVIDPKYRVVCNKEHKHA